MNFIFLDVKSEWLFEISPEYFNPRNIKHIETRRAMEKLEKQAIMIK